MLQHSSNVLNGDPNLLLQQHTQTILGHSQGLPILQSSTGGFLQYITFDTFSNQGLANIPVNTKQRGRTFYKS